MKLYYRYEAKFTIIIIFFVLFSSACFSQNYTRTYIAEGSNGAVSCGHPLAAKAAINVLKSGGNAVDAAVAAAFALGVVDFTNSGLGGEAFALICNDEGKVIAIDGSTRRPVGQIKNQYDSPNSLPAIPEMLIKMNRVYGKAPLAKLVNPAIELCDKGFEVSQYLSDIVSNRINNIKDPAALELLAPNGNPIQPNQILKQPKLAKTLKQLKQDNGLSFYYGSDADKTLADMKSKGSFYTKYDFMKYKSKICKPVILNFGDKAIFGHPFPSSSPITIKLAEELAALNLPYPPQTASETLKLAYLYRKYLNIKHYDSAKFINKSQAFISSDFGEYANEAPESLDSNTTHLCVWDKDNLVVSMTLTNGNHFGTGELAPGGFFYANSLRTFSNKIVNYPKDYPGYSGSVTSKSPIIVTKSGKPWLAIGGAGADRIITNTATVLANVLNGRELYESLQAPRFYMDYYLTLYIEKSFSNMAAFDIDSKYCKKVYKPHLDDYFGLVSAIQKQNGVLTAVGDQHRDGSCAAY